MWARLAFLAMAAACLGVEHRRNGLADFVSDKQLYLSKKSRFIKFDTKDNEVEIELGISIPVVKIPLEPEVGKHAGRGESGISISAPGLVVAGVLMLTTFLIVPALFSPKVHKFRSDQSEKESSVLEHLHDRVYDNFVRSPSCLENIICWTANTSANGGGGSIARWMDNVLRTKWMERLIQGTFVQRAIAAGRSGLECSKKYPDCPMMKSSAK